jgi:hypothetical protein
MLREIDVMTLSEVHLYRLYRFVQALLRYFQMIVDRRSNDILVVRR